MAEISLRLLECRKSGLFSQDFRQTAYAQLLADKIGEHKVECWLVNTGWSWGLYGAGSRMEIKHTRALLNGALSVGLNRVEMRTDPNFSL